MVSTLIHDNGEQLLHDGRISQSRIDDAVRRILRVKFRAGLFEHPYVDPAKADAAQLRPDAVAAARKASGRSMVLLKNEGKLPFSKSKSTAVIGPLGDDQHDMLGPWWGRGEDKDVVTVFQGIKEQNPNTTFTAGCTVKNTEPPANTPSDVCGDDSGFAAAVAASKARRPGRARARRDARAERRGRLAQRARPARQAGGAGRADQGRQPRQADRGRAVQRPPAHARQRRRRRARRSSRRGSPASQAGNAVADVVFGDVNPGGKLPVSFPRSVGQVPIYYNHENTGRPCDATSKYNSRYRDINSCDPQYVFGYGLSYSKFEITNLRLSSARVSRNGSVRATVDVQNVSGPKGDEVVQLYIHDPVASLAQPVRRLRGFERVTLAPRSEEDRHVHARQERLELLRQPREAGQRARSDRRLRGRQLEGGADQVVPGHGLTATATSRVSTPNGDPSRSP